MYPYATTQYTNHTGVLQLENNLRSILQSKYYQRAVMKGRGACRKITERSKGTETAERTVATMERFMSR